MNKTLMIVIGILFLIVLVNNSCFVVDELHSAIIIQMGEPKGKPILDAGLKWKIPFIQQAILFDKRILEWDGNPKEITTRDKKFIFVDTTARWRIVDPLEFYRTVHNEEGAQRRLDGIIDGITQTIISNGPLSETVRNNNREMVYSEEFPNYLLFRPEDFKDLKKFVEKLGADKDPLSKYIKSKFTAKTQKFLEKYAERKHKNEKKISRGLERAIVNKINQLMQGNSLYSPERFKGIDLSEEVAAKTQEQLRGISLFKLNRNLLEEAYPNSIGSNQYSTQIQGDEYLRQANIKIENGREKINELILERARKEAKRFGIEIIDVLIKRINYTEGVRRQTYKRMISERQKVAKRYRAEGQADALRIRGRLEELRQKIRSGSVRKSKEIRGKADAEAIRIYAENYKKNPEFYTFLKTLENYRESIGKNTIFVLSTRNEYLQYLKSSTGHTFLKNKEKIVVPVKKSEAKKVEKTTNNSEKSK